MCCVFCIEYGSALACSDLVEYGYFERENLFVKELLPFLAFRSCVGICFLLNLGALSRGVIW